MLIADMVPWDVRHWQSFVILLKICSIAVSPVYSHDTGAYLRVLVEEKLEHFTRLYPEQPIILKQHYMVHYPSQIERFGPLIQSWNMRQGLHLVLSRESHNAVITKMSANCCWKTSVLALLSNTDNSKSTFTEVSIKQKKNCVPSVMKKSMPKVKYCTLFLI